MSTTEVSPSDAKSGPSVKDVDLKQFGTKMTSAAPGSAENLYLIVSDIEAARDQLIGYITAEQAGEELPT